MAPHRNTWTRKAGWLSIARHAAGALEFRQQVEEHQNARKAASVAKNSRRQKSSAASPLQLLDALLQAGRWL